MTKTLSNCGNSKSKECMEFVKQAKNNNWDIVYNEQGELKLNESILDRYKKIPNNYLDFLKTIKQAISPNEKT